MWFGRHKDRVGGGSLVVLPGDVFGPVADSHWSSQIVCTQFMDYRCFLRVDSGVSCTFRVNRHAMRQHFLSVLP